jgi:hypothetical protein
MPHDCGQRGFYLLGLANTRLARAACGLRRMAGSCHPIDGEHLPPDQSLAVTHHQYLGQQRRHGLAQPTHARGHRHEVRLAVIWDRHTQHVLSAGCLDGTAADEPLAVGQPHDLEPHGGRIGRGPHLVVANARLEGRPIALVVDEVTQRLCDAARPQLAGDAHRHQPHRPIVDMRVARHCPLSPGHGPRPRERLTCQVFLQPQRPGSAAGAAPPTSDGATALQSIAVPPSAATSG